MATNKFTYKTYQEESNYYQKCSYEFEEKNKSLQQRMTDQENQSAQKIHELETQLQLMAEDEKAYENDAKRLNDAKGLQQIYEKFELEKQFLADYTSTNQTVRVYIQKMLTRLYVPLIIVKSIHWDSLFIIWKPLMDIDYIMRIQKQVPNQFTFFVTA